MIQKRKAKTLYIIPLIILLCITIFGVFYSNAREYLRSICNSELADYATHNAYSTRCELEKAIALTQTASESFSSFEELHSKETLQKLAILSHDMPFETMSLCTPDGIQADSKGAQTDISNTAYFQRTLYGESSIIATDINSNQEPDIIISSPVISDGKVIGTLHGLYRSFDLSKIINVDSFNGKGYAILVNSNGDIIIPDTSPDRLNTKNENYWTFFQTVEFSDSCSYTQLLQNIKNRQSGLALFSLGEEQRELYYTPIGMNDWYLLQMVTTDVVINYTKPMTRMVFSLTLEVALLFLVVALFIHGQLEHSRKEKALETERFRTLSDNIPGGVAEILIDDDFLVTYANDGFYQLMGYSRKEFMDGWIQGHCMRILFAEDSIIMTKHTMEQILEKNSVTLEYQIKCGDNSVKWIHLSGKVIHDDHNSTLIQAIVTDITLQKKENSEIMENAKLDKMTQLYDKVSATEVIENELNTIQENCVNAILILDIDNFKHVNDTFGHPIGDIAIIMIANTLKNTFRGIDLKGRIGGDEFIVLMRNVTDISNTRRLIDIFLERVRNLELAGKTGELSCSIGGVVADMSRTYSFEEIFRQADQNLYQVKKAKKGVANITSYPNNEEDSHA